MAVTIYQSQLIAQVTAQDQANNLLIAEIFILCGSNKLRVSTGQSELGLDLYERGR